MNSHFVCLVPVIILLPFSLFAGSVINLKDGTETDGKLTLNATSIHVENGGVPMDIQLADVLMADFSDKSFTVDYFSSSSAPGEIPSPWVGQNIGEAAKPGSFTYSNGTLSLDDSDGNVGGEADKMYFFGRPWNGSGTWSVRLQKVDDKNPQGQIGWNFRETLEPGSRMFAEAVTGEGTEDHYIRKDVNNRASTASNRNSGLDLPRWMRFTRNNESFEYAVSKDGQKWDVIDQDYLQDWRTAFIGLMANSDGPKAAQGVYDNLMLKPVPAEPKTVSTGVLLRGGTYLSGVFAWMNKDGGMFDRNGTKIPLTYDQVAVAIYHPITLDRLLREGSSTGVIMKNNDFLEAPITSFNGNGLTVDSLDLGLYDIYQKSILACLVHPIAPAPSSYEVRLDDGSIVHATGMAENNGKLILNDLSGVMVQVAAAEVAQLRAGSEKVQNLIDSAWKSSSPVVAATSPDPAPNATPNVETWQGPHQEQMLVVAAGCTIYFPLSDNFRSLYFRMALSPDSPANAQASCQVFADGGPMIPLPTIRAGEPPQSVYLPLQNPKVLTFSIHSSVAGARVLLIDPTAIRRNDSH